MGSAHERLLDALRDHGSYVDDKNSAKVKAQCPAHDDTSPSLSIGPRRDGKGVVVNCHAGCDTAAVMQALNLTMVDLFDENSARNIFKARRDYRYPDGRVVHRKPGKGFPQSGNTKGNSLFHADRIGDAKTVYVPEGEKDVEAIEELAGAAAVCPAMGSGKAHLFDWEPLRGKDVIIIADRDQPGRKHAHEVAELVRRIAASVQIVEAAVGKDAADHLAACKTLNEFVGAGPEPVDGAALLDDLERWFTRFIAVPDPLDLALIPLWAVSTHLAIELYTTPRIQLDSTMHGSGKTTVLDHLYRLCWRAVQAATLSSPALIPRLLENGVRTLLLDEVNRSLRPDRPGVDDLIGIINTGYRVGATRPVLVPVKGGGWEAREMPTFAPVVMAGNSPQLPDDTRSRTIRVLLMPDLDGSIEDSDWEDIEPHALELHSRIAVFADAVRDHVKGMAVDLPDKCIGRTKEKWRPLKRVAVAAGGRWPAVADELIARGMAEDEAEREAGLRTLPPGMVILTDLHAVWPAEDDELLPTRDLVARLIGHNADYWGESSSYGKRLTDHRFAKLVAQASKATSLRPGGRGPRGYLRKQFEPTWHRLGICRVATGASGETGATGATDNQMHRNNQMHRSAPLPHTGADQSQLATATTTTTMPELRGCAVAPESEGENGDPTLNGRHTGQPERSASLCPCGRPAPVDPETGLCQWCTLAASKAGR
jgi:hypothetical protein